MTSKRKLLDASIEEFAQSLNFCALREGKRVFNIDAEIADGAFNLRVAKQNLDRTQVTRLLVDDGGFRSPKRVRSIVFRAQCDPSHPLIDKSGRLSTTDMIGVVDPAWKHKVIKDATSAFEPSLHAHATGLKGSKLNGPPGLLLDHDRARPHPPAADEVANFDLNAFAPTQLTIDSEIKHRTITEPMFAVEPKPDGPNLLWLERAFRALHVARIPRVPIFEARIVFGMSHSNLLYRPTSAGRRLTSVARYLEGWPGTD
jgi:hypothetical protein